MRHLLILAALAAPAMGGEPTEIPVEEWREMAMGKTLVYAEDGEIDGFERYPVTGDWVEYQHLDGTCHVGRWWFENGLYCFDWDGIDGTQCYRHLRSGERILVVADDPHPNPGEISEVLNTSDIPLLCGENMS